MLTRLQLLVLIFVGFLAGSAEAVTLTPGNIIMIGGGCGESLCHLDTGTGDVTAIAADFEGNELAVESAHSVLILDRFRTQGTGGIVRVDTRTGAVTPIVSDNPDIGDVVVHPTTGDIYAQLADSLVRVDGATGALTPIWEPTLVANERLLGITSGPDGSLITTMERFDDIIFGGYYGEVFSFDLDLGAATSIGTLERATREISAAPNGNVFGFLSVGLAVDGQIVRCCGPDGALRLQFDEEFQHNYPNLTVDLDGNAILGGRTPLDEPTWHEILVFDGSATTSRVPPIASFDLDGPVGALEVVPAWVPEPSTAVLFLLGLAGLGVRGRATG